MGYDRGDSFLLGFEPNGIPFGSEYSKKNCHHDHIPFNMEENIVFPTHTHTLLCMNESLQKRC